MLTHPKPVVLNTDTLHIEANMLRRFHLTGVFTKMQTSERQLAKQENLGGGGGEEVGW